MKRRTVYAWVAIVLVLAGGAMLALVRTEQGSAVGSTAVLAGLVLAGWIWFTRASGAAK